MSTLLDQVIEKAKNHSSTAAVMLLCVVIIGAGSVFAALDTILNFADRLLVTQAEVDPAESTADEQKPAAGNRRLDAEVDPIDNAPETTREPKPCEKAEEGSSFANDFLQVSVRSSDYLGNGSAIVVLSICNRISPDLRVGFERDSAALIDDQGETLRALSFSDFDLSKTLAVYEDQYRVLYPGAEYMVSIKFWPGLYRRYDKTPSRFSLTLDGFIHTGSKSFDRFTIGVNGILVNSSQGET